MKKLIPVAIILSAITACNTLPREIHYGNDALASDEVLLFQEIDKKLKFKDARIEYNKSACAVYQGINTKGEKEQVPLVKKDGSKFCRQKN